MKRQAFFDASFRLIYYKHYSFLHESNMEEEIWWLWLITIKFSVDSVSSQEIDVFSCWWDEVKR